MIEWSQVSGFQWDTGNARKSLDKHAVSQAETEQVFFNQPLLFVPDSRHSEQEVRYHALGVTDAGRRLHITLTLRGEDEALWIRVISARDMHAKRGASMSKQSKKSVPAFNSEADEQAFWESHDSTDYVDWSQAEQVRMPNLKPSTKTISLRLPVSLLENIKIEANKRDVPYQSLIKAWLSEHLKKG